MSPLPYKIPQTAMSSSRVSLTTRIGWGFGGVADNFMANTLFVLGMIIYVTAFNMPAGLAGLALSIPRFADAITDPLIGNFSDNFKSRWGRRRPLMVVGAIGSAILLPMFWFPPMLSTVQNPWYSNVPFWWMAILGSLYFLFYTLFMVPYTALGFELTDDYDERTKVLAWRMYLGLFASMTVPALYWACRQPVWGGEVNGAIGVSVILSFVILATGLAPVFTTRERVRFSLIVPRPRRSRPLRWRRPTRSSTSRTRSTTGIRSRRHSASCRRSATRCRIRPSPSCSSRTSRSSWA